MPPPSRTARVAAAVDLVCLAVFVLAGRQSHDIDSGGGWYVTVLWPFLVGWFASALVFRLYTSRAHRWWRLTATIAAGIGLSLVIRALTQRATPLAFVVVAYAFIALLMVGWRLIAKGIQTLPVRRRR